ncbi:hypothetical protein ACFL6G_03745 [candidate division KSB1 bacterium]
MKKFNLILMLMMTAFLFEGCHHVFVHSSPGIVIRHKRVITTPTPAYEEEAVYEDEYEDDVYEEQDYEQVVETDVDIFIGTSIAIYGSYFHWCDYCCCWHPRCSFWRCYCHPTVIRHYGFYRHNIYIDHCYHWVYEPHYYPVISRFRFRHNGRYYAYNVAERRREFLRRGDAGLAAERVRYRGKEEIRYTYDKNNSNSGAKRTVTRGNTQAADRTNIGKASKTNSESKRNVNRTVDKNKQRNTGLNKGAVSSNTERKRRYERDNTNDRQREVKRTTNSGRIREYTRKNSNKSSGLKKIRSAIKKAVPKISREISKAGRKTAKTTKKTSKTTKTTNRTRKTTKKKGGL